MCCPWLDARSIAVTHRLVRAISRRTSQLRSVLPSLTAMISQLQPRRSKNSMVCAIVVATISALLYTGMTTLY